MFARSKKDYKVSKYQHIDQIEAFSSLVEDANTECWSCNFTDISSCGTVSSYAEIAECVGKAEFQQQFTWEECSDHIFNRAAIRNTTEPWETSVTEFGLFCGQDEINALLTSMGMVGLFIGAFIAGLYADKFGRKNAIMVFTVLEVGCQVAHAFMPNVWGFMVFRVLGQMTNHVTWIAYISYSVEILGPSKRSLAGAMTHVFYSFGYMATSLVGYLLPDWHGFTLCLGILTAVTVITFPFYPGTSKSSNLSIKYLSLPKIRVISILLQQWKN